MQFSTLLVPTDGSDHAHLAVELAADLAIKTGAKVILVRVLDEQFYAGGLVGLEGDQKPYRGWETLDMESPRTLPQGMSEHQTEAVKEELRAEARRLPADVSYELKFAVGSPRRDILALAEAVHADAIVMGSRGLGSLKGMLLGSVSSYILQHAKIPVLIAK